MIVKKSLLLILCLFSFSWANAQSKADKEKAYSYVTEAIKIMDAGHYDQSIALLRKAQKLGPKSSLYPYEIGYAYYLQKKYKKAIVELKKAIKLKGVNDQNFQLLGNCYDNIGKPQQALKAYNKGLKKFPKSGKLYLEQGILESRRENYDLAIAHWEKGIEVEPDFPSNYYHLARIFSYTDERVWTVIYGELFMNIERNTDRTVEISKLLFDTYKKSIEVKSDTSLSVNLSSEIMMLSPDAKEIKIPFGMVFSLNMSLSAVANISDYKDTSIHALHILRTNFVKTWFEQKRHEKYLNLLFDFHKELEEKGYLEAYNYWVLMKGNEDEFGEWYEKNEEKFNDFANWFNEHPLEITLKNYFSRIHQ